jgi:1,4-dihydroxy-2-naphthoate octaprenyltransferase
MSSGQASVLRTWLVAVRPFAYTASFTSVFLGLALSVYEGNAVNGGGLLLCLLGVFCFHTAANLLNDCYDHRRGLDTEVNPQSGAVVRGWLTERQVFRAAMGFLVVGVTCGLLLTWMAGATVLALGLVGAVIALGYTRAGPCLKYAGLGDGAIFLAFGVLPVFGTYWVQAGRFSWLPLLWSVPLVSPTVGILHANNWRDLATDAARGCQTPAVRLGERGSASYYRAQVLGPFVLTALYLLLDGLSVLDGLAPAPCALVVLALPCAVALARTDRARHPEAFAALDGKTARLQLLFGVLLPAAFFAARFLGGGPSA